MRKALWGLLQKIQRDHVAAYAGQAALFLIMSIIPFLLILLSAVKLTPITKDMIYYWLELFAPESILAFLKRIVSDLYNTTVGYLIASIAIAIFSAAKTIQSLQYSLNIVYETRETRNWFILRFWAIIETSILMVALLLFMGLLVFGRQIQNLLTNKVPMAADFTRNIFNIRIYIMFFILILVLTWIYKVLPNRKASFKSQLPGGVLCSIAWYLLSFIIRIYNTVFHGFSVYGSLTTIVIMMFWLYYAFFLFLVCGEINNQFERLMKGINDHRQQLKIKREQIRAKKSENTEAQELERKMDSHEW